MFWLIARLKSVAKKCQQAEIQMGEHTEHILRSDPCFGHHGIWCGYILHMADGGEFSYLW